MKLNIPREALLKPLQTVIGVVERKQTLPILSNVLLSIKDKKLSVTGTDLEIELIGLSQLEQAAGWSGSITLPGRKLMEICKALPDGAPIELYQEKERVVLRSGQSSFTLSTLPATDFPNFEENPGHLSFTITQQEFRYLLQRTHFAMAEQDVRYFLNGMLFEAKADMLCAVATDGHRLAFNTIPAPIKEPYRLQIIVPRKGILELMRLLGSSQEEISVSISNNQLRITHDECTFTCKLIEGRFPDYDRVIPKEGGKQILLDRDILKQALSRTAILCNEKFHGVRLELRPNLLQIFANNAEQEAAEEEIQIDYAGENLDIGFNVHYLLDVLNCLNPGLVKLSFTDSDGGIRVEEHDNSGTSTFVVMPMRL